MLSRILAWAWCISWLPLVADAPLIPVGAARIDISPTGPVPLMGYASRATLPASTNTLQPLQARALAIGPGSAVLVTLDNCILPGTITAELRSRLQKRTGIVPDRIAFSVTHTHNAPCLSGAAPNILGREFTPSEQAQIDAYTRFFMDQVERVILRAIDAQRPSRLAWGQGRVGFARNRRTPGGPVVHDLPILRITAPDGTLRSVLTSYACHCTTLGDTNSSHGDWAGVAAADIESSHPGTVALVAIGCGADANPDPRGSVALAEHHGHALAREVQRLLALPLEPLSESPVASLETLDLPFQPHFTREQWERRAATSGIVGHHARRWIARLDRGEFPAPTLPYPVQTFRFSTNLAMIFLGGEVVVDYALRLKTELDPRRLWINAYANDVPGYIPSWRILGEGGYEAESSLWYYDRPQQFDPTIEDRIIHAVRRPLDAAFSPPRGLGEMTPPTDEHRAIESFSIPAGLTIDLVAGDSLVQSPVAIDFAPDGRLWVAEMNDYPAGEKGQFEPGGRVKVLEDTDHDGRFDRARIVATGLPFPTGLMAWKEGVLVCAAPEVLWISADGRRRETLLTGFATHNYQARVNGLRRGLDGWIYGSGGLFGGRIRSTRTGREWDATGRDFRFQPDTGRFEALPGVSQQGRVRDDFGEWFGNDNGSLLWHYPLPPSAAARGVQPPRASISVNRDDNRVFPTSRTLERFNDPHTANHLTSACAPEIHRGSALGPEFTSDAFICEPVHNLIRRAQLHSDGVSFAAHRAPGESQSEFLSSSDNWFRPVEVRTGPDGCLWIVDMYRFVIEHPRWISAERLARLDPRAGANRGRIYRMRRSDHSPSPLPNVAAMEPQALLRAIASPEGPLRDLAQEQLALLSAKAFNSIAKELRHLGDTAPSPAVRLQVLWTLAQRKQLPTASLRAALADPDPRLRCAAIDLADAQGFPLPEDLLPRLTHRPDMRFHTALHLAHSTARDAGRLATLMLQHPDEPWLAAAADAAVRLHPAAVIDILARHSDALPGMGSHLENWITDWAEHNPSALALLMPALASASLKDPTLALPWYERIRSSTRPPSNLPTRVRSQLAQWEQNLAGIEDRIAFDPARPLTQRRAALALLTRRAQNLESMDTVLIDALDREPAGPMRDALTQSLGSIVRASWFEHLTQRWPSTPAARDNRLRLLLVRKSSATLLATALRQGHVPADSMALEHIATLRRLVGDTVVAAGSKPSPHRRDLVERYQSAARLTGQRSAGAAHFDRLCASCHALNGRGHAVGPDLSPYRSKPVTDLILAVLDPNAAIDARHRTRLVVLQDGRELTGVIAEESNASFILVQPGGLRERIPRNQIARLEDIPTSLMPEGFEASLTPQDLADLAAWIRESPRPFGSASPIEAAAHRTRWLASQPATNSAFQSIEPPLVYASWMGRLPMHPCRQDHGTNRVQWITTTSGPSHQLRWPVAMGFHSQPAGSFTLHLDGRPCVRFDVALDNTTWNGIQPGVRLRYLVEEAHGEDSNGVLVLELPAPLPPGPHRIAVSGSAASSQRWFGIYRLTP